MAFNWQTFRTRTLTASVFLVVMLGGLLTNRLTFIGLFSLIHFGCWWEFFRLVENSYRIKIEPMLKYALMLAGYLLFLAVGLKNMVAEIGWQTGNRFFSLHWLFYFSILVAVIVFLAGYKRIPAKAKGMVLLAFPYISLSLALITALRNSSFNWVLPVAIISSLWINDTMAYIVGSLIGKTPLSPVSPKKTWEGTIAGIILSTLVMGFFVAPLLVANAGLDISHPVKSFHWFIISFIASVAGTFGDLFESSLKRMAGVKDSGRIMPGHGGFLDRFDSLLFASPAVWLYLICLPAIAL